MDDAAGGTLIDRLAAHRLLSAAPRSELEWFAAHASIMTLGPGEVLTGRSGPVAGLFVVLSGHLTIHVDRGNGPRLVMEWRPGDITGLLPYSRLVSPPGDVVAQEATEICEMDRAHIPGLILECHELTSILVHVMVDRARQFVSSDFQDEKLVSLGKLAAGLAHELNNPVSAMTRNVSELRGAVQDLESASRSLNASTLSTTQMASVTAVRERLIARPVERGLAAIERCDREDELASWLSGHEADMTLAGSLVERGIAVPDLADLCRGLSTDGLDTVVRWLAADCSVQQLLSDTEIAAGRVHALVAAVKGFTYMDQAGAPMSIDIAKGFTDTAAVLAAKARNKTATIDLRLSSDLPRVHAIGAELNQIWAYLVDNALDAVQTAGTIVVTARAEGAHVVVRICDDGPGIPAEIQTRVFDPFFTTKPVGQGMGLGARHCQAVGPTRPGNHRPPVAAWVD